MILGNQSTVSVNLQLEGYEDQERLDRLGQQLHDELRDEDGLEVEFQTLGDAPPGSKGLIETSIAFSSLLVAVASSHDDIATFADVLVAWVRRQPRCRAEVEINGQKVTITGGADDAVKQIVDAWNQSQRQGT